MTAEPQPDTTTEVAPEAAGRRGGPRTEAGKARARLNALKHGLRARAVDPVALPHEDPAELQARIDRWLDDQRPADSVERELVERAARLSWALVRAERHEAAIVARQIRGAMLKSRSDRAGEVCDLGRKLFYMTGRRTVKAAAPAWDDDPSAFVARLEEIPEGARWLLDRWRELRGLIAAEADWGPLDQFKMVRLLGKHPIEAINDPELNRIVLAWEALHEGWGVKFWNMMKGNTPEHDPAFSYSLAWRALVPRPESVAAAVAIVAGVVDREIERLEELLAALDEIEGDDASTLAEEASFCASDAGERLRRHQTARTRELHRTIELLAKLRASRAAAAEKETNELEPAPEPGPGPGPAPPGVPAADGAFKTRRLGSPPAAASRGEERWRRPAARPGSGPPSAPGKNDERTRPRRRRRPDEASRGGEVTREDGGRRHRPGRRPGEADSSAQGAVGYNRSSSGRAT